MVGAWGVLKSVIQSEFSLGGHANDTPPQQMCVKISPMISEFLNRYTLLIKHHQSNLYLFSLLPFTTFPFGTYKDAFLDNYLAVGVWMVHVKTIVSKGPITDAYILLVEYGVYCR